MLMTLFYNTLPKSLQTANVFLTLLYSRHAYKAVTFQAVGDKLPGFEDLLYSMVYGPYQPQSVMRSKVMPVTQPDQNFNVLYSTLNNALFVVSIII